jgi:hypothetical protein
MNGNNDYESPEDKKIRVENYRKQLEINAKKNRELRGRVIKSEANLENFFCNKVKEAGGWAIKGDCASVTGIPDRIVFYEGFTWLVELKSPTGKISPVQESVHRMFEKLKFKVRIIRTKQEVFDFIKEMQEL